jgi:hypothetical protein
MVLRMSTLLAKARGDEARYRDRRDRYRPPVTSLGFAGHMQWARGDDLNGAVTRAELSRTRS